jgi:hypothetical protein
MAAKSIASLRTMDNPHLYFLKISGTVRPGKQREFQQTVLFIFNHLPNTCISRNLALDLHQANLYHIYSLWRSRKALLTFRASNEFELLKGAFETLGVYHESIHGVRTDINLFEVNDVLNNLLRSGGIEPANSESIDGIPATMIATPLAEIPLAKL